MFIAQRATSQHDTITTIPVIAQMLDVNPKLKPKYFCFDAACDAEAIYSYLRHKGILPIIDRHPKRLLLKDIIAFPRTEKDENGKPCIKVLNVYNRTSYKFFGPVNYRSDEWKELYNNRTSC